MVQFLFLELREEEEQVCFFGPAPSISDEGGGGGGKGGEGGAKAKKGPTCFQKERGQQLEQLEQQRKINVRKEKSYIRPAPITLPGGLCAFHREGRESLHVSQQKATKCVHIVRFFFFFIFFFSSRRMMACFGFHERSGGG